jgi:hypothetical protein
MRAVRLLAAVLRVLIGGYLLLIGNGISGEMWNQTHGWHFFPLPSHPRARIVAYLTLAIALQLGSAWLLTPAVSGKDSTRSCRRYAARVAFLLVACLVVAALVAFAVMALLDSGTIWISNVITPRPVLPSTNSAVVFKNRTRRPSQSAHQSNNPPGSNRIHATNATNEAAVRRRRQSQRRDSGFGCCHVGGRRLARTLERSGTARSNRAGQLD